MSKLLKFLASLVIAILLFLLFISVVEIQPEWFPIFPTLPTKMLKLSQLWAAFSTLALAFAAFVAIRNANELELRRKKETLLNNVAKWSANVRKYCASLNIGFNTQIERSTASDRYFELKYDGENLLVAVEKENLEGKLKEILRDVVKSFDGPSSASLADHSEKRRALDDKSEQTIIKVYELLSSL